MRKSAAVLLSIMTTLGLTLGGIVLLMYITAQKPELGSTDFTKTITVQVLPNLFYDVDIPLEAQLKQTNMETTYEYDLLCISVVDTEPQRIDSYVQLGNKYVAIISEDNWLVPSRASISVNLPYSGYVDLALLKHTTDIPEFTRVVPRTDTLWYPDSGGFFTYAEAYRSFAETVTEYAAKMVYLYGQKPVVYYHSNGVFTMQCGSYFVGVKYLNFNTTIGITAMGTEAIANAQSILF